MGLKLAGFQVLGCNEINQQMVDVYIKNHHPKYVFTEPIQVLKNMQLPEELYHLDLLNGSPPCCSFSISGKREKLWGRERAMKTTTMEQRLEHLFYEFIEMAKKLRPKVVIAENVAGLSMGNARGYMLKFKEGFENAGYDTQIFSLNAASMGVPQKRQRLFYICRDKTLNLPKLELTFNEPPVPFSKIYEPNCLEYPLNPRELHLWNKRKHGDKTFAYCHRRMGGKGSYFNMFFVYHHAVVSTLTAGGLSCGVLFDEPRRLSRKEMICAASYPEDFDFLKMRVNQALGRAVPPVMMARIATEIKKQWFEKYDLKKLK